MRLVIWGICILISVQAIGSNDPQILKKCRVEKEMLDKAGEAYRLSPTQGNKNKIFVELKKISLCMSLIKKNATTNKGGHNE